MFKALRRYHLTLSCACHPGRIPRHGRARLAHIPGLSDLLAAQVCREHHWEPTPVVLRYDGHEEWFTFTPVWHNSAVTDAED